MSVFLPASPDSFSRVHQRPKRYADVESSWEKVHHPSIAQGVSFKPTFDMGAGRGIRPSYLLAAAIQGMTHRASGLVAAVAEAAHIPSAGRESSGAVAAAFSAVKNFITSPPPVPEAPSGGQMPDDELKRRVAMLSL